MRTTAWYFITTVLLTAGAIQNQPVFRSGTAYVVVDVVVTGKDDRPVADLTAADFEIREGGRKQTILDFERVTTEINDRPIDLRAAPGPAPDVASNPPLAPSSRAFAFVIDEGTIPPYLLVTLKEVMTNFLRALSADDRVAIVFVRRSDLGQDFTNDVGRLIRAVNNTSEAAGMPPDLRATRLVLQNALTTLAAAPQTRRAIVYVSGGFGVRLVPETRNGTERVAGAALAKRRSVALDVIEVFNRARRAGVPIYTIDPAGLGEMTLSSEFLMTMAVATGGVGYVNQSDLPGAVRRLMADNSTYYVLGYSPSPYTADGKFHEIDVKITSRSGLRVRARPGYVATPPRAPVTEKEALLGALAAGQPQSDIGLRAFAAPVMTRGRGARVLVSLDVSYREDSEAVVESGDKLQVIILALDPDGRVVATEQQTYQAAPGAIRAQRGTLSLQNLIDLPRGKFTIRIGATSHSLGKTGTVHLPLEVPAASNKDLRVSPLILGLSSETSGHAASPGESAKYLPFQPTTLRSFAVDQEVRVFARIFGKASERLDIRMLLKSGDQIVRTIPVRVTRMGSPDRIDCEGVLPISGLPAGAYVLEFAAGAPGSSTVTRSVALNVK